MNLTKTQIAKLAWPKGATHLKVTTANGKNAVATKRSAAVSLDGIDGEWQFGVVIKDGKKETFKALPNAVAEPVILPPSDPPAVPADVTTTAKKSSAKSKGTRATVEGVSKCAFIRSQYQLTPPITQAAIYEATMKAYPNSDPKSTMNTVRAQVATMRSMGLAPMWVQTPRAPRAKKERGPKRVALDAILAVEFDVEKAKPAALKALINALRAAYAPTPANESIPAPAA